MDGKNVGETVKVERVAAAKGLTLLILRVGELGTLPLPETGEVILGRGEDCGARVDDDSVSRRHAALTIGEPLTIEDLGSANGTRLRDVALKPGEKAEVAVGEVITLGNALVIVQSGAAPAGGRRVWPHGYFEARLEEECARAARKAGTLALLRLHGSAGAALGEVLRPFDVLGSYGPDEQEVLLLDVSAAEARQLASQLELAARLHGDRLRVGLACYPGDGTNAHELAARAGLALRGGEPRADVTSDTLRELERTLPRIAGGTISVLILGETGVGKEVLAERVHRLSPRAAGPFLRLHCAALSESLLESELFGHERGAFTGADRAKPGLLETAEGGTVFLDEVGEFPASIQVKLLRVLEERKVQRVGALTARSIDVRFVAATNRDLEAEVARGAFRQDLYFRLNGFSVVIPPLRERTGEIAGLTATLLALACRQAGIDEVPHISREAQEIFRRYRWPGNVRELRNVLERAVLLCAGDTITVEHLPLAKMVTQLGTPDVVAPPRPAEEDSGELDRILDALAKCAGNQSKAAKMLGISRGTLVSRLDRYGVARPRKS